MEIYLVFFSNIVNNKFIVNGDFGLTITIAKLSAHIKVLSK